MENSSLKIALYLLAMSTAQNLSANEPGSLAGNATLNLCSKHEEIIFNCLTGKKVASLCISKDKNKFIQYRFGTIDKVEINYPTNKATTRKVFKLSSTPYPGGGENRIRFSSGIYNYYMYDITKTASNGQGPTSTMYSGMLITKKQTPISSFRCSNEDTSIRSEAFESIEVEKFDYNLKIDKL